MCKRKRKLESTKIGFQILTMETRQIRTKNSKFPFYFNIRMDGLFALIVALLSTGRSSLYGLNRRQLSNYPITYR